MAILSTDTKTLADLAKQLDPDGSVSVVAEILSQANPILEDIPFKEGNLPTGSRVTMRTGLPAVFYRMINQGVPSSKSHTAQVDEQTAMLEAFSEIDKDLVEMANDIGQFRMIESKAFIEAMGQRFAQTLFYGNTSVNPQEFTGLAPRYSSLAATNAQNILNAGGVGSDNTSIWLIGWGDNTVYGHYPKNSKAGLQHEDLGIETVDNVQGVQGTRMRAYRDRFQWKGGLVVKDWRYVVRAANIDVSNIVTKTSAADLPELMIKMIHRLPNLNNVKPVFYCSRSTFQMLDIQRRDDALMGGGIAYKDVDGILMPTFRGIPVKLCDQILETESVVA